MPLPMRSDLNSLVSPKSVISNQQSWPRQAAIALAGTALITLCAHISVSLPFTPVPLTMQTFAVLLVGILFGPTLGAATLVLYLAEGAAGLPVFSPHGLGGMAQLAGPSAGYLLSYPVAALLAGAVFAGSRRLLPTFLATLAAASLADIFILLSGSTWLLSSLRLSVTHAVQAGMVPFLAGEALKLLLLGTAITALQPAGKTN